MKMTKRMLSILLVLAMTLTFIPMGMLTASAATAINSSGTGTSGKIYYKIANTNGLTYTAGLSTSSNTGLVITSCDGMTFTGYRVGSNYITNASGLHITATINVATAGTYEIELGNGYTMNNKIQVSIDGSTAVKAGTEYTDATTTVNPSYWAPLGSYSLTAGSHDIKISASTDSGTGAYLRMDVIRIKSVATPPTATATLSGTAKSGQSLSGTYTYNSSTGKAESGTAWALVSADNTGFTTNKATVQNGTSNSASTFSTSYMLTDSDLGKYFRLEVTPKDSDSTTGTQANSSTIGAVTDSYGGYLDLSGAVRVGHTGGVTAANQNTSTYVETSATGTWQGTPTAGYYIAPSTESRYIATTAGTTVSAKFIPTLSSAGLYKVEMVNCKATPIKTITLAHNGNTDSVTLAAGDANSTVWADLGYFYFAGTGSEYIQITSNTGSLRVDAVKLTKYVAGSTDTRLLNLVMDTGALSPTFASGTTSYTAVIPVTSSTYKVRPLAAASGATITVNGQAVSNDLYSQAINNMDNANIVVTNGGSSTTYTIAPSVLVDTEMSSNYTEVGTWQESTVAGNYGTSKVRYPSGTGCSATWNPTISSAKNINIKIWRQEITTVAYATYEIHHNGKTEYRTISYQGTQGNGSWYDLGNFDFSGTGSEYVIANLNAIRADAVKFTTITDAVWNADATLTSIAFDNGTAVVVNPFTTAMSTTMSYGVFKVTPKTSNPNATISVNGGSYRASGVQSGTITIPTGTQAFTVTVKSQDTNQTKIYTITVTVPQRAFWGRTFTMNNAPISNLKTGTLVSNVNIANNDNVGSMNIILVAALFDKATGQLYRISTSDYTLATNSSTTANVSIDVPVDYANYTLKIFTWDDFNSMMPYDSPVPLN